jgi:hypothetical protein
MLRITRTRTIAALAVLLAAVGGAAAVTAPVAGAAGATVTLTSSPNPSLHGQAVALVAKVVAANAADRAGAVTFTDGGVALGTVTTSSTGVARLSVKTLDAGTHALGATFAPADVSGVVTASGVTQVVNVASTTTTLVTSKATANYGDAGSLTATVKPVAPAAGVPTGSVDFSVDGGWYLTVPVDANGRAKLLFADLFPSYLPGTYQITASYTGDANNDPSTSAAVAQTLVGISAPPVTTLTLNANGLPVFNPRSFTMQSTNPVGCNVTITNSTPNTVALAYGTPGNWKRLPFGGIAPGASKGIGVGIAPYTGYFTTTANTANYVAIHCI